MNLRFWTWGRKATSPGEAVSAPKVEAKRPIPFGEKLPAPELRQNANPFVMPAVAEGVIPKSHAKLASDSAMTAQSPYTGQFSDAYDEGLVFLGYPVLSSMSQRAEYRRPSEIIAKEMTRKWLRITSTGDDDKAEKIGKIEAEMRRLNAQRCFREAIEQDGLFGRSQIYLDMGDVSDAELAAPLSPTKAKISPNKPIQCLRVIEPIWTYPGNYNSSNPLADNFFKPESWWVLGRQVHASRLLLFVTREVSDILKPAYAFGGLSLTQLMKPYVDNWLSTRQAVNDLIRMFSVSVLKTEFGALTQPGGTGILSRVQEFNAYRNNRGTFLVDKQTEDFANVSTPLGTLDALQAQAQEHQSSACGVPLVKLFGITPKGLNGSTDGEIQAFYEWLESLQEGVSPQVKRLLDVIQLSLFGEIDSDITHQWEPLKHMDELQAATVQKTEADTDAVYIDAGVLAPEEVRARLAADESGTYTGLDVSLLPEVPEDNADPAPDDQGNEE